MRSGGVTGIHPTAEGYLYISANTPRFWQALCERIGLPALAADVRYDTVRKRAEQAEVLLPQLHAALAARSALAWEALFGEEVPCAAARQVEDMFDHPQVQAAPVAGQLPRHHAADRVRPHARPGTVRRAGVRSGHRGGRRAARRFL
jgi:formyl-CoA transferase